MVPKAARQKLLKVRPVGASSIVDSAGRNIELPRAERALITLLTIFPHPIKRADLASAIAVSESSLASMLSRLARNLGNDGPVHRTSGSRSGMIELVPGIAELDLAPDIHWVGSSNPPIFNGLELSVDNPLVLQAAGHIRFSLGLENLTAGSTVPAVDGLVGDWDKTIPVPNGVVDHTDGRLFLGVLAVAASGGVSIDRGLAEHLLFECRVLSGDLELTTLPGVAACSGDTDFRFVDVETAAYCETLLANEDRRWLHTKAFTATRHDPNLDRSTVHALRSGDTRARHSAMALHLTAAQRSGATGDTDEEIRHLDAALALQPTLAELVDLTLKKANAVKRHLPWTEAINWYRRALEGAQALGDSQRIAAVTLQLARLTWEPELGREAEDLLLRARRLVEDTDPMLVARIDLCLAGGTFQDGTSGLRYSDRGRLEDASRTVQRSANPLVRASGLLHARQAMLGDQDARESLAMTERAIDLGDADQTTVYNARLARYVDLLRLDRRATAAAELRTIIAMSEVSQSNEQRLSGLAAQYCWDTTVGRFSRSFAVHQQAKSYASALESSTYRQIIAGQGMWLALETGQKDASFDLPEADREAAFADSVWVAGAGLFESVFGEPARAAGMITKLVNDTDEFKKLAQGAHFLPTVCLTAEALFRIRGAGVSTRAQTTTAAILLNLIGKQRTAGVLVGWPTVFMGPTARFKAMLCSLVGANEPAVAFAEQALHSDRWTPAHLIRSLEVASAVGANVGDLDRSKSRARKARDLRAILLAKAQIAPATPN